jgi:hypothetical protein
VPIADSLLRDRSACRFAVMLDKRTASCLVLFQRQEMSCPGHVDQRRPFAWPLLKLDAVFGGRDLIIRSLQDELLGLSWRCPPGPRLAAHGGQYL